MASSPTPAGILTTVLALGLALLLFAATTGGAADVGGLVTDAFFDGIKSQNQNGNCEGRDFYTRSAFLNAANQYSIGLREWRLGGQWQARDRCLLRARRARDRK
jgi:hypothetical protein